MTAFVLNGVAFAKSTLAGYQPGMRIVVDATINLDGSFATAVDALNGAAYSASAPVTSVTYKTDTGTVLGTVASPGSVTVTVGVLQRKDGNAGDGKRTISASIPDYMGGSPNYAGNAYCTAFAKVGTLANPVESTPAAPTGSPGGFLLRYYNNLELVGEPVLTVQRDSAFHLWGEAAPDPAVTPDFSARWTGKIKAPTTGTYRFYITHDDGVRMYVDGRLAIDAWGLTNTGDAYTGSYTWNAGEDHAIWIEYVDGQRSACMQLYWYPPGATAWSPVDTTRMYPTDGTDSPPPEKTPGIQASHYVEGVNRY